MPEKVTLADLKRLGLRPGTSFEKLVSDPDARSAFEDCTGLKLAFEFPLLVDGADPCFVTFAHVGDGTEYGFYVYPPSKEFFTCDPVVQWDHDGPSVEFESQNFAEWLSRHVKDAPEGPSRTLLTTLLAHPSPGKVDRSGQSKLIAVLPTAKSLGKRSSILRFLQQPPPKEESSLVEYERQWNRCRLQSVFADDAGNRETTLLLAYGIETYDRLTWSLPSQALKQEDQELDLRSEEKRPKHEATVWAKLHPPSTSTVPKTVSDAVDGVAFSRYVIDEWIRAFSFDRSLSGGEPARHREMLGEYLRDALPQANGQSEQRTIGDWLVALEWAQAAEMAAKVGLSDVSAKLKTAAYMQELGRGHAAEANDWSDVKG